ncbi:ras-related protein Rab-24 isoform X2 [Micropterus salmoides]|uniref:ras-related protein Rab-24 isoform X2 n=1 Tax=Micropterus salmoides TaxID=27706 RepID=UPI0018ED2833|nr:ras-related protein Rab-24 isoform X2 [Micropterus salmoides]
MSAMRVDAKVVMLGKESVGKTSLVERYVHHRFLVGPYQNTIGAAFVAKPIQVGEKVITLGIWDTAGSERYEAMSRIYYRGARAALVCYDLTDSSSFQRARFWVKELQTCEEHCKIYLCGTKNDLVEEDRGLRQIDYHDAQDFAEEIGAQLFETSSKTGSNVVLLMCSGTEHIRGKVHLMDEGASLIKHTARLKPAVAPVIACCKPGIRNMSCSRKLLRIIATLPSSI